MPRARSHQESFAELNEKAVEISLGYKPLPKQEEFHGNNAKYRFFGGGWGNGKTSAGCVECMLMAVEYPGTTGVIARQTRPTLKASTQHTFFHGGGGGKGDFTGIPDELIRGFNKSEQRLELINGSIIHFWPLDDPEKLSNLNLSWFMIDQAEEVPEDMFIMLQGRLRQMRGPRKGICLFNPAGHDWIWKRNVHYPQLYDDHSLIHAKTSDNPNLPEDYIESLMKMPEAWRKRFLEGSWDTFEGQIWPEFDPDTHVIRPFPIPDHWEVIEGIDHGLRNPTAVLWAAFDEYGNCFIVDEHHEPHQLVGHHARMILEKRAVYGEPEWTVIDASSSRRDPVTGTSVIDEYEEFGILTMPSDRHIPARINRVAQWLYLDKAHPHYATHEINTDRGNPRLYIFANCVNLIEHIAQYKWRPASPSAIEDNPEQPLKKDDHDVDALGYILMTRPAPAEAPINEANIDDPRSARYWQLNHDRIERARHKVRSHSVLGSEA